MRRLFEWGGLCAFMLLVSVGPSEASPGQTGSAKAILEKDAECTACHNEAWATPVLVDLPESSRIPGRLSRARMSELSWAEREAPRGSHQLA